MNFIAGGNGKETRDFLCNFNSCCLNSSEVKAVYWLPMGRIESADTFCLVHIILSKELMESFGSSGNSSED